MRIVHMLSSLCGFLRGGLSRVWKFSQKYNNHHKDECSKYNNYIFRAKETTLLSYAHSKSHTDLCSELGSERRSWTLSLMFFLWKSLLFHFRDEMLPVISHTVLRPKFFVFFFAFQVSLLFSRGLSWKSQLVWVPKRLHLEFDLGRFVKNTKSFGHLTK